MVGIEIDHLTFNAVQPPFVSTGVSFVNFGDESCSPYNTAIMTNLQAEDFLHPIHTNNLEFIDTPEANQIYLHRPSLG